MSFEELAREQWRLHDVAIANGYVWQASRFARIAKAYEREAAKEKRNHP